MRGAGLGAPAARPSRTLHLSPAPRQKRLRSDNGAAPVQRAIARDAARKAWPGGGRQRPGARQVICEAAWRRAGHFWPASRPGNVIVELAPLRNSARCHLLAVQLGRVCKHRASTWCHLRTRHRLGAWFGVTCASRRRLAGWASGWRVRGGGGRVRRAEEGDMRVLRPATLSSRYNVPSLHQESMPV